MNHISTTSKKTLFILSSVESTMGAASVEMSSSANKLSTASSYDAPPSKPSRGGGGGGFGSLLRRVGGSQRSMEQQQQQEEPQQQQHQQQPMMTSESERGLGSLFRRARGSLQRSYSDSVGLSRGGSLDRCQSDSAASTSIRRNRRLDTEQHDEADDGPSGVASFLQQIEDPPSSRRQQREQQQSQQTQPIEDDETARGAPPSSSAEQAPPKKQGMIRGLINRAASFRSSSSRTKPEKEQQQQQPPDLEPVLVLTDGNHGKVVFQNLDIVDPAFSGGGGDMDSSIPDLCASSRSDSPSNNKFNSSFHTARTSATARDSTLDDQYFLDFSEREELAPAVPAPTEVNPTEEQKEMDSSSSQKKKKKESGGGGLIRGLFRRTKSGRLVASSSSSSSGGGGGGEDSVPEVTTTDDSSGESSDDSDENNTTSNNKKQGAAPTSLQEITLPCLVEDDEDVNVNQDQECILDVFDDQEDIEDEFEKETCCSTSSGNSGDDDDSEGDGEIDIYSSEQQEEFTNEPPAPRVYDELELFYEEQTFEHVGGSLLLGSQSELMTVPEYDEEDYDSEEEDGHLLEDDLEEEEEDLDLEDEYDEEYDDDDDEEMLARKSNMSLGAWLTPIKEEKDDLSSWFSQDTRSCISVETGSCTA